MGVKSYLNVFEIIRREKMKKVIFICTVLLLAMILAGCSKSPSADSYLPGGEAYDEKGPDGTTIGDIPDGETGEPVEEGPQAGQLTASEWSDLKGYPFWRSLFESSQELPTGVFSQYFDKGYFDTLHMIDVTVKNGDTLLSGALVELNDQSQNRIYAAVTDACGVAYLFPQAGDLSYIAEIKASLGEQMASMPYQYSADNDSLTINMEGISNRADMIEIMFVIDTTGSMGDEIAYLKSEIDYVITEVQNANPDSTIRMALLIYRDQGDVYVTRYFDFTTDIAKQKTNLSLTSASGGGDFEEAVDVALQEAVSKDWSAENTTKLIFHVLDAPPHYTQENMTRYHEAITLASQKGIRMIPVASSGIDKYTEYLLRNEAMMTGGTYVFLTNHSGIGGDHLEATVGETVVEYLKRLLVRLINEYHTGVAGEKVPYDQ
jgi:hypothetical protein